VANLPEGSRSRSRSVLISLWNCSWVAGGQIFLGRAAGVPLDEIVQDAPVIGTGLALLFQQRQMRLTVEATVFAHQQRGIGQMIGTRQHALEEGVALLHGVLLAGTQLQAQAPALVAQIGRDGGVAVDLLVGSRHAFLAGVAVVHHEGVDIQADMVLVRGDRRLGQRQQGR